MARKNSKKRRQGHVYASALTLIGVGFIYTHLDGLPAIDSLLADVGGNFQVEHAFMPVIAVGGAIAAGSLILTAIGLVTRRFRLAGSAPAPHAQRIFSRTKPKTSRHGWVYVLENPAMPGICKVGFTGVDPHYRARQLNTTGVAEDFKVAWAHEMLHAEKIERQAHRLLAERRVNERREFFRGTVQDMIRAVQRAQRHVDQIAGERGMR